MSTITPDQVFLRDYTKIFTGTNQEGGYESPSLGFLTDTVAVTLKADKSSYFHYPKTAIQMALSATDLINTGAFAGAIPYKADKIFKKQSSYEKDMFWGASTPENMQKGTWLCAWLSGNINDPTQQPVWVDRWYKPGYIDSTQSYFVCTSEAVFDTPSIMTFDPGVWYRYDHIGDKTNLKIVEAIDCLTVHVDEWVDNTPIDTSGFNNDVILYNYTDTMKSSGANPTESPGSIGIRLNGINQYGSVLYSPSFDVSKNMTCSVWVKSNDWQTQSSHHILSNGLRGGWSVSYNNGFFTPFNILLDESGNLVFNNQTGNFYKDLQLPGVPHPVSIAVDSELYTWILDNGIYQGQKHLYKVDYNGNIDSAVYFSSGIELFDLVLDKDSNVWVSNNQVYASAFNTYCELISTTNINGTKLLVNSTNTLTAVNAIDACVFEDTNYWIIDSNKDVYYNTATTNNTIVLQDLSASNVQCTKDHIWVLYDGDKIIQYIKQVDQLTNTVSFIPGVSTVLPDAITGSVSGRNIFFTNEFNGIVNTDYIWILQPNTEYLYKYDTSLNLLQKISLAYTKYAIQNNAVKGDASGYRWNRLFNYGALEVTDMPQIEASVYMRSDSTTLTGAKYTTSLPISAFTTNDWHMITFSVNTDENKIELYIDTILRDTTTIPVSTSIFYKYETPLLLGSNVGHINTLDEELNKISRIYHSGSFDDLRIYTCLLNNSDIRHIYLTHYKFKDLTWNMPTGVQSYIEEIVRFFKFKMPGQKSQYYNIHLKGLQIQDVGVREIIEGIIRDTIQKIAPFYTSLYKIVWD